MDDDPIDEEVETKARDHEAELPVEKAELDPNIDMLSIQVISKEDVKADDGSWKHTGVFSTTMMCQRHIMLVIHQQRQCDQRSFPTVSWLIYSSYRHDL